MTTLPHEKSGTPLATCKSNGKTITQNLIKVYDEMRARQRKAILLQKSMRSDPYFESNPARLDDDRRCLAISCVMDDDNLVAGSDCLWTDAYWELQSRLKDLCGGTSSNDDILKENDRKPAHMRFGQSVDLEGDICGQLHFTLMQLVGFPDYDIEINDNSVYASSQYMDCVQDALIVGGMDAEVKIHFIGCIAVATGLLMIGVPSSVNLNGARDCVRENLEKRGLPLKEPFVNDIVHSTLFRVTQDQQARTDSTLHTKILDLSKEFEHIHLGTVTMRNFQIGPASWRMLPSEMVDTPPWRKWTLPNRSTQQEYHDGVIGAPEQRNCYTLSGASGANLAKEIRRTLSKTQLRSDGEEIRERTNPLIESNKITEERAENNNLGHSQSLMNLFNFKIGNLNSPHYKDCGYAGPIDLHTELNGDDKVSDDDIAKNAATVSGASGVTLAQELQKRMEMEKQRLISAYQKDFF